MDMDSKEFITKLRTKPTTHKQKNKIHKYLQLMVIVYTDGTSKCIILSVHIYLFLLKEPTVGIVTR